MGDPTSPRLHEQTPNYPVDGNGQAVLSVTPGKWGYTETFPLKLVQDQAIRLVDGIIEALVDQNPSLTEQEVINQLFPEKTMEIVGWLLINTSASLLFVGGPEAADDFGVPCIASTATSPGTLGLASDPNRTYVFSPANVVIAVNLVGARFGADEKPGPGSHLDPVHESQNPDPVFVP